MRPRRRLATRLAVAFGSLFAVAFALVLVMTLWITSTWFETAVDDTLRGVTEAVDRRLQQGGVSPEQAVEEASSASLFVEFRDATGGLVASASVLEGRVIPAAAADFDSSETQALTGTLTRSRVRMVLRPVRDGEELIGYVVAASPLPALGPSRRQLLLLIAASVAAGLGTTLAGTFLLSRWIARPLTELAERVRVTAESDFAERLIPPETKTEEVRALAAAIEQLVDQQRLQLQREQAFFADSSHVLRTPLTVLQGNVELLAADSDPASRAEAVEHIQAALETMSRTVGGLLLLARRDELVDPDWEIFDIAALAREEVGRLRSAAPDHEITIDAPRPIEVSGNFGQLSDLLTSLLENAVRYTPSGGQIDVGVEPDGEDNVRVTIADRGIGMSSEEARRATERFFRGYEARKLFPGGSGLGLSIAARLATLHRGSLSLEPREGGGSVATLILPRLDGDLSAS